MHNTKHYLASIPLFLAAAIFSSSGFSALADQANGEPPLARIAASKEGVPAQVYPTKEIAPEDKRITLNIDKPAGQEGPFVQQDGKYALGSKPVISRIKQKKYGKNTFRLLFNRVLEQAEARPSGGIYTLKDCVDIAVKNHLPLQIAKKSVKLAESRLFEARRNLLPTATIDYEEYHGRVTGQAYVGRKQYIEGQQPIFRGGELFYTMKQAEVNREITKNDYNRVRNELVLQVKKGYYTLAKAKNNFVIQQALSKEVERIFDMVNRQAEAGVTTKIEVLNVTSQSSQVKYQLVSAEGDLSVAELILKQAMNVDPDTQIDVKESLEFKKVEIDFEGALAAAMVSRPEMRISSKMIDYYNYGKGIAKAKFWPKVDLLGQWGLAKEEFSPPDVIEGNPTNLDEKIKPQWYAGLKTSMPFWGSTGEWSLTKEHWVPVVSTSHGTDATTMALKFKILDKLDNFSDKLLSEIDFDKARQELTKIKHDITLEVKESCFNYEKALIQSETARSKVKYQTSDLELAKLKRGMDEAQDSNVIESMIKLAQEKFGYLQALSDCHIALAAINKAVGAEDFYKDEEN